MHIIPPQIAIDRCEADPSLSLAKVLADCVMQGYARRETVIGGVRFAVYDPPKGENHG